MGDAPRRPPRGFLCPQCAGVRLVVYRTRRPARGLVVRYRECPTCGFRAVTEERARPATSPSDNSGATSVPTS